VVKVWPVSAEGDSVQFVPLQMLSHELLGDGITWRLEIEPAFTLNSTVCSFVGFGVWFAGCRKTRLVGVVEAVVPITCWIMGPPVTVRLIGIFRSATPEVVEVNTIVAEKLPPVRLVALMDNTLAHVGPPPAPTLPLHPIAASESQPLLPGV
jgi:hypothetical protein